MELRTVVMVNFDQNFMGKNYAYLTDLSLEVGDKVVVEAKSEFSVGEISQVRGLTPHECGRANKWVVQKVNLEEHTKRKERQQLAQEIRNKLRQRKNEMEEILIYERLAERDPEIQNLLKELATVDGGYTLLTAKQNEIKKEK